MLNYNEFSFRPGYGDFGTIYESLKQTEDQKYMFQLARWFEDFGTRYWNGECYQIESDKALYPVYQQISEDEFVIVDWYIASV